MSRRNIYIVCTAIILLSAVLRMHAQERFENDTLRAYHYLRERGEVYFSFNASHPDVRRLSNVISVDNYAEGTVFAYANREEFEAFLKEGLEFVVFTPPGEWHRDDPAGKIKSEPGAASDGSEWDYYPLYDEYVEMMKSFAENYPDISRYIDAGSSVDGRSILFLKISGNKETGIPKPRFMYSSTMHGDETVGFILMLRLIEYLLENYPEDEQVERLLDNVEIWINPLANPDGSYYGGDGNTIVAPKRSNANNIDLNRNFPALSNTDYTTAGRQPETVIMMELIEEEQFALSANLHGGAEVMNYPWDTWERRHADDGWFEYICREYADTAILYSPSGYMTFLGGVTNGYDWYSIFGGRQDYVTYFTGGREVTMEISSTKHPPASSLPSYWEYNRRSLMNYIEQVMFGVRGEITDAETGEPLQARVEILSHDLDSSYVWSDQENGWYFRLIEQGTYDLIFSAGGYHPGLVENVQVANREATRLDVMLNPVATGTRSPSGEGNTGLYLFRTPGSDEITIGIDLPVPSFIKIALYDLSGRQVRHIYNGPVQEGTSFIGFGDPGLGPGVYIVTMNYDGISISRKIALFPQR